MFAASIPEIPLPFVTPISGGVYLEWKYEEKDLYFEIDQTSVLIVTRECGEIVCSAEDTSFDVASAVELNKHFHQSVKSVWQANVCDTPKPCLAVGFAAWKKPSAFETLLGQLPRLENVANSADSARDKDDCRKVSAGIPGRNGSNRPGRSPPHPSPHGVT